MVAVEQGWRKREPKSLGGKEEPITGKEKTNIILMGGLINYSFFFCFSFLLQCTTIDGCAL